MKVTLQGTKLLAEREVQEEYDLNAVVSELENLEIDLARLQARKSSLQEILEEAKKLGYSTEKEPANILEGGPVDPVDAPQGATDAPVS